MKVQEHIGKISWSLADKALYFIYGLVTIVQMNFLEPSELGLYGMLIAINTWLFIVADSFALTNVIQFGMNNENEGKVNTISLTLFVLLTMGTSFIIYILKEPIAKSFGQPQMTIVLQQLPLLSFLLIPRSFCLKFIYKHHLMFKLFLIDLVFFGVMSVITFFIIGTEKHLTFSRMVEIYYWGSLFCSIVSIIFTYRYIKFRIIGKIKLKEILKFSFPMMALSAVHTLPKQLDVLIIQYFFSTTVVGIYYSAKTLFRVFEETVNAAIGLVYPAAVRQLEKQDYEAFNSLLTKSISFIFVSFLVIVIVLELGLSKFFITTFLPARYLLAIDQFNLLIIGALGLPLMMISTFLNSLKKNYLVLISVSISTILSFTTFLLIGKIGNENLVPLGYIVYIFTSGVLFYFFIRKLSNFKIKNLFFSIKDITNFILNILKK